MINYTNNKLIKFLNNNSNLIRKNNHFNYSFIIDNYCFINNKQNLLLKFFNLHNYTNKNFFSFNKTQKKSFFKKTLILNNNKTHNFYDILGIDKKSTNSQIKQAYLKLAKQHHPDVNKEKGSDEKFKTISIAYEALSNQKNRELHDASMGNDPNEKWNNWKDEEDFAKQDKTRARQDGNAGGFYRHSHESNFWKGERDDFEDKFYKDYENIFGAGWKESKPQKGEDILVKFLGLIIIIYVLQLKIFI